MEKKAPLEKVYVADTVIQGCLAHALTTEQEEVMGLLLGEVTVHYDNTNTTTANTSTTALAASTQKATTAERVSFVGSSRDNIGNASIASAPPAKAGIIVSGSRPVVRKRANVWSLWVMQRSVRRSDRVEVAPEMLAGATDEAERCTKQVGRPTRVIGWYHSHPRITPYPSQVDLRSQESYQLMESGWVGLIFSVFYSDTTNKNSVSIHCFQTGPGEVHEKIEMKIVPVKRMPLMSLPTCEVTSRLLRVFRAEVDAAVELVRHKCKDAPDAVSAALALQEVQLYTLEKLIAQPALRHLKLTIKEMEREVQRLENELNRLDL